LIQNRLGYDTVVFGIIGDGTSGAHDTPEIASDRGFLLQEPPAPLLEAGGLDHPVPNGLKSFFNKTRPYQFSYRHPLTLPLKPCFARWAGILTAANVVVTMISMFQI